MTLIPIGVATMTATLDRVVVGWFSGALTGGQLLLKVSTIYPGNMSGFGFGVVSFVDGDTNARVLGDVRYYPKPEPTYLSLGYGDRQSVAGDLVVEPRAYNLRWLTRPSSPRYWRVLVEAETPGGVSAPSYLPAGYARAVGPLTATGELGTDGNIYGRLSWND